MNYKIIIGIIVGVLLITLILLFINKNNLKFSMGPDCDMKCVDINTKCHENAYMHNTKCRDNCINITWENCLAKCRPLGDEKNQCMNNCTPVLDKCIRDCDTSRTGEDNICSNDYVKCNNMCK